METRISKKGIPLLAALLTSIVALSAGAYDNYDNWCDREGLPHYLINTSSFISRGFPATVASQIKDSGTYWHQPGGDFDVVYEGTTSYCDGHKRICAKGNEDQYFSQDPDILAYTHWVLSWYPWCDFFGLNLHEYWINVNASRSWALSAPQARIAGHSHFGLTVSHELGHGIGADHTQSQYYPKAMMYEYGPSGTTNPNYLQSDDGLGLYANYGKRDEYMKLRTAIHGGSGTLTFYTTLTVGGTSWYKTHVRPAIAGNWHQSYTSDTWDYVIAWVSPDNRRVRLAILRDDGVNSPVIVTTNEVPGSETTEAPTVTVGPRNTILVAWRSEGQSNYIKTALTNQNFTSFTTGTVYWEPMTGPVLSYIPAESRYVLSWVVSSGSTKYRVAVTVSTNGTSWYSVYTYPGSDPNFPEFVTSPWHAPAITCMGDLASDSCLMLYKQFRTSDSQYIDQQAFQLSSGGDRLETLSTDWSTWNTTYANLAVAAGDNEWVYSHVENTTARSKMWYRVKPFWKGVGGDYRHYATLSRSDMISRVGFPVGYNYKRDYYKFLWTEH
jgi:hypothetical protein